MTSNVSAIRRLFAKAGRLGNEHVNLPSFEEIYPNRDAPVLRNVEGVLTIETMKWGLPPPAAVARPVTNVRNLASPFWRSMLTAPDRRCLVPVTSFCEWEGETGSKHKVWFTLADSEAVPFAFAGIWRPTPDGNRMAFLTCEPNEIVGAVHSKAMPVILHPASYDAWLGADHATVAALARPFPSVAMRIAADA